MTQSANYIGADEPVTANPQEASRRPINRTTATLLLIVALAGSAFFYMHWRTGPQAASAATVAADAATANRTVGQFLSTGPSSMKVMEAMLHNTEKVVQQFNSYPSVGQVPLSGLRTNPFRQSTAGVQNNDDAAGRQKLDEQRQAVQKAYQTLQLQSIMYADKNNSCLINNTLYREGQLVNGFSIEKISPDNVSIKQGAWRFELKMQK